MKNGGKLRISYRPLKDLIPDARNARTHSEAQVAQIAASIGEFGFTNPVLVDERNGIIAGHGRALAAETLGLEQVPCIELVGLSDAQRRAYVIADNKLALNAGWDVELLAAEFLDLEDLDFDLDLTGFDPDERLALTASRGGGLTDPDTVPEVQEAVVSSAGDTWLCGRHRVRCGDSTKAEDVEGLLGDVLPHLMVTDPPYGIGYGYATHKDDAELNDELVAAALSLAPKSKVYTPGLKNLRRELNRFPSARVAVWHKKFAAAGNGMGGASTWEPIMIESPLASSLKDDVLQIMTDRVEVDGKSLRALHSCPKPALLFCELLRAFSRAGDGCYDPFLGSGTTMIAAEKEARACYGMEIAPQYVDVAVRRWQDFTGKEATLDGDGRTFDAIAADVAGRGADQRGGGLRPGGDGADPDLSVVRDAGAAG